MAQATVDNDTRRRDFLLLTAAACTAAMAARPALASPPGDSALLVLEEQIFEQHNAATALDGLGLRAIAPSLTAAASRAVRVMKAAKINYGGDKHPCVIRDLAPAALEFSYLIRIPDEFTLIMPEDRLKLSCGVVWRSQYRVGVRRCRSWDSYPAIGSSFSR